MAGWDEGIESHYRPSSDWPNLLVVLLAGALALAIIWRWG